jgi:hypothetical protein
MKAPRPYSRHGLNAPMARIKLRGFSAIDRRTAAAREHLAFRRELANALGGEADLTPQQRKLIDLAARASALLDHVDAWLFQQPRLVNARAKTLLPILVQRQALADHLVRLLDKLPVMPEYAVTGGIHVERAMVIIPDNGRDPHLALGATTNGQLPPHRPPEPESSPTPAVIVDLPPRDGGDFVPSTNGDRPDEEPGDGGPDDLERDLGLC